ncbi:MAG TPA: 2,3-bisphosphoglycerate-independent phosphoglycerate mutase, partial [Aggregatilineales bacterium]|nr:2,3-bisphosphoglycerate-independent phosphoglycerate mutase [Aggregatilineales bacterium]
MAKKPVMLIILDGWGIREFEHGNAVALGNTPNYDRWMSTRERAIIDTFGEHVGLTSGQMGNSEVGHLNLGAGRVVYQDITRIENAITTGALANNPTLTKQFDYAKAHGKNVHLIGLLGTGGVHSYEGHLFALLDISQKSGINPVIHVITDGRDTPQESGVEFLDNLTTQIDKYGVGQIATVSGRYYAMDRDKRWERTKLAFDAMVNRVGETASSAKEAIQQSYAKEVTDEFIIPTVIGDNPNLAIQEGDVLIFYNFRSDRMRQITQAFSANVFEGEVTFPPIIGLKIITFTEHVEGLPVEILFPPDYLNNTLAEVISTHGKTQYHSAETEKYPHVTFFFNGRREEPFEGESRRIIPSPKVATYDLQPEMSAQELTDATLQRLDEYDDDFLLINFANPDMVGHTGILEAAIKAVEFVDTCAGKL